MQAHNMTQQRPEAFVRYVIGLTQNNKGKAADLRRADNPSTEYQSWETLIKFGIDLENKAERLAYQLIAAAISKAKVKRDGIVGIGIAIASCFDKGALNDQAKARLRRLLACETVEESCAVLRQILQLISSKGNQNLSYTQLLKDLIQFNWNSTQVKIRWASNFYMTDWKEEEE